MNLTVDGEALALAWLVASCAKERTQADQTLNRTLVIHEYRDAQQHPAGLAFAGMSRDLVIVASVPYAGGSVGPRGLYDLLLEADPTESWPVHDETGRGKKVILDLLRAARKAKEEGGTVPASVHYQQTQAEGQLLADPAIALSARGIVDSIYVPVDTSFKPRDWRLSMPNADDPTIPTTAGYTESRSVYDRLSRAFAVLGRQTIEWQWYTIKPTPETETTTRYMRIDLDDLTVEISAAAAWDTSEPLIFNVPKTLSEAAFPDRQLDEDDDEDPIDPDASNVIERVFGR